MPTLRVINAAKKDDLELARRLDYPRKIIHNLLEGKHWAYLYAEEKSILSSIETQLVRLIAKRRGEVQ